MARDFKDSAEFSNRVGMIIDAQTEIRIFFLVMDENRGRLATALVAARRLSGLEHVH
jgi:hypothetical protein